MTSGYGRMVTVEVVLTKVMGSISYYVAATGAATEIRNKALARVETMMQEMLQMYKVTIEKVASTSCTFQLSSDASRFPRYVSPVISSTCAFAR